MNAVAFHPDGKLLALGSSDGTILCAALADMPAEVTTLRATKAEVRSIGFSPDGKLLAAGLRYGTIKTWHTGERRQHLELAAHDDDVWSVAFTPDGKTLVSGDGGWDRPGQVKLWDQLGQARAGVATQRRNAVGSCFSRRQIAGGRRRRQDDGHLSLGTPLGPDVKGIASVPPIAKVRLRSYIGHVQMDMRRGGDPCWWPIFPICTWVRSRWAIPKERNG